MGFHRLVAPSYLGGLPAGYDYINDPVTNGDAGVAAFADGKKGAGVNAGTYFVAFNEDATSSDANRGMKALAQNTDALDDILHKDVAFTARTADVTAGSAVSSVVIAGQIYVGDNGVANTQQQRDLLVSVLDNNDNEILVGTAKVQASFIQDGSGNNVVGTQASGFYNTVTVGLNVAIPVGVTYRLYYGYRGSLANMPKDAFTSIKIRGAQEVEAAVERVLRDLHTSASGTNWDDPWVATINSLARTGLDGRYRLSTTDPGATPALNTPGNGGTVLRDGPALAVSFPTYDLTTVGTVGVSRYPDQLLAGWRMKRAVPVVSTVFDTRLGGDVGITQESPYHNTGSAAEVAYSHVTGPLLLDVIPRNITASAVSAHPVMTRISAAAVATVNPTAGSDAASRRTIACAAGDFIRNASGRTGVRKTDLIEVTDNNTGLVVGTFILDAILTDTTFTVLTVTGAIPPLGPTGATANIRMRWLQPTVSIGGQQRQGSAGAYAVAPLFVAQAGLVTDDYPSNDIGLSAIFMSAMVQRELIPFDDLHYTALTWGGFDTVGVPHNNGALLGDGGIICQGGRQSLNIIRRKPVAYTVASGVSTITHDLQNTGAALTVQNTTPLASDSVLTFALDLAHGYAVNNGDEFTMFFSIPDGQTSIFSVVWPADFFFSLADGVLPATNTTGAAIRVSYSFCYNGSVADSGWYAKRTDY